MPAISRLRGVLPTGLLPLPVWSELGDLSVLKDRNHWMCVDTRAHREVLGKACLSEGAAVLCVLEQPIQPVAIPLIDETACVRRVVETDVREPLGDSPRITART